MSGERRCEQVAGGRRGRWDRPNVGGEGLHLQRIGDRVHASVADLVPVQVQFLETSERGEGASRRDRCRKRHATDVRDLVVCAATRPRSVLEADRSALQAHSARSHAHRSSTSP